MTLTTLPTSGYFSNASRRNSEAKSGLDDVLAFIRQSTLGGLGTAADSELTISSGSITPDGVFHTVDTESDAASDDLTNVAVTNINDGGFLLIQAEDTNRTVVVKSSAGGSGQFVLQSRTDFILDGTDRYLLCQRQGTDMVEVFRGHGGIRTWTPGLEGAGAGGTYTLTARRAEYIEYYDFVTINFDIIDISESSAGTGDAILTGLPFIAPSSELFLGLAYVQAGSSGLYGIRPNSGGFAAATFRSPTANSALPITAFTTGNGMQGIITYEKA
jgi:hypothetical protein